MFRITKRFHFSTSHQLCHEPEDHQCARLHGHNFGVVLDLAALKLNAFGLVRDYHDLPSLKRYFDEFSDHRHLNEVLGHDG
jgi:6-pyruvoyltetrahydropterin/6-carboxytetrahydropterin synthase